MNTQAALEKIKNAMPLADKDMQQAAELLQKATNDFTDIDSIPGESSSISDDAKQIGIDPNLQGLNGDSIADYIDELGISKKEYNQIKDESFSLKELVKEFAMKLDFEVKPKENKDIEIAKAKAAALKLRLRLKLKLK